MPTGLADYVQARGVPEKDPNSFEAPITISPGPRWKTPPHLFATRNFPTPTLPKRAEDLFRIISDTVEGKVKPVMGVFDLRMINSYFTTIQPMKGFVDKIKAMEGKDGILSISLAFCFPYAEAPSRWKMHILIENSDGTG